jgi:hypothetical protein
MFRYSGYYSMREKASESVNKGGLSVDTVWKLLVGLQRGLAVDTVWKVRLGL